jgi:hypothetical protein
MNLHLISPLAELSEHEWTLFAIFGFVALIVLMKTVFRMQRQKLWHETARAAIDKGQPLPPAPAYWSGYGMWGWCGGPWAWGRGLIWVAFGVGLYFVDSSGARKWAPLPICVGAAMFAVGLIQAFCSKKNDNSGNPSGLP